MNTAYCMIRAAPEYRRESFHSGLMASGYQVSVSAPATFAPGDLLVIWSRYGAMHELALRAEAVGVQVLVAENAYIWRDGISPHHLKERPAYALARGYHNDSTVLPSGDGSRWNALGVELQPWRENGKHILVCPNRPFGTPGRFMQPEWVRDVAARLRKMTKREIRIRPHPGNDAPSKPLADDMACAHCVVIWSSSAGVHALVAGVPVICEAPFWIAKGAACDAIESVDRYGLDLSTESREAALQRLAWGQFSVEEIASGYAFTSVLRGTEETKVAPLA